MKVEMTESRPESDSHQSLDFLPHPGNSAAGGVASRWSTAAACAAHRRPVADSLSASLLGWPQADAVRAPLPVQPQLAGIALA